MLVEPTVECRQLIGGTPSQTASAVKKRKQCEIRDQTETNQEMKERRSKDAARKRRERIAMSAERKVKYLRHGQLRNKAWKQRKKLDAMAPFVIKGLTKTETAKLKRRIRATILRVRRRAKLLSPGINRAARGTFSSKPIPETSITKRIRVTTIPVTAGPITTGRVTRSQTAAMVAPNFFLAAPSPVLLSIVLFVAPQFHRARITYQNIALTCRVAKQRLQGDLLLAAGLLKTDYNQVSKATTQLAHPFIPNVASTRVSPRLHISPSPTPIEQLKLAHSACKTMTTYALDEVTLLTNRSKCKRKREKRLTKANLIKVLDYYGPSLFLDGSFLVQICRAKQDERVILNCVKELVEAHGVAGDLINVPAKDGGEDPQTALWVAAVRGLPEVVLYLLQHGANEHLISSGTFGLRSNPNCFFRLDPCEPLEAATIMLNCEKKDFAPLVWVQIDRHST